jgi:hypothetical protein
VKQAVQLELHIEQSPTLAECGEEIGIVTAIIGIRRLRLRFIGRAAPASTSRSQRIQSPINSSYTPTICLAIFSQV